MKLIAAVDNNWAIGCEGDLLVHIPADLRFFQKKTTGNIIITGRKTLETFPGGRPLKDRLNIVLTKNRDFQVNEAVTANSLEEVIDIVKDFSDKEIYVVGGESIYRQFLPFCDTAYITKINYSYAADAYFPDLDKEIQWELIEESEENTYYDLEYTFCTYKRTKV